MNRFSSLALRLAAVSGWALLLPSCVIYPANRDISPQLSGRVLDAATHQPVAGAVVLAKDQPKPRHTKTDASGHYFLERKYKTEFVSILSNYNSAGSVKLHFEVSHPGYRTWDSDKAWANRYYWSRSVTPLEDILLVPEKAAPADGKNPPAGR